jgi:hypothetical protein
LSNPLIISYYTEETPYQFEALSLIQSCRNFEIEAEIVGVPARKSWAHNCALKPFFIRDKFHEHKRPLFWIDVDAHFLQKPDFSEMRRWDMGVREMKCMAHVQRFRYISGSLFFNYNTRVSDFLDGWCDRTARALKQEEDPVCLDQISLADLIESGIEISIYPLPVAYAKIFDLDAKLIAQEDVVIEHHQASRVYKNLLS